jgi:DnaJ-class molecular chaperone
MKRQSQKYLHAKHDPAAPVGAANCPDCQGTGGTVEADAHGMLRDLPCPSCDGTGLVLASECRMMRRGR